MNEQAGQGSPADSMQHSRTKHRLHIPHIDLRGYIIGMRLFIVQYELFQLVEFGGLNEFILPGRAFHLDCSSSFP